MTVSNTTRTVTATGNSVTTVFPYAFKIPTTSDLIVSLYDKTTLVTTVLSTSVFSVTGIGSDSGGNVTYPLSGSPITSNEEIIITRTVAETQALAIANQGGFLPNAIETQLDLTVMQIQQLSDQLGRTVNLRIGSSFAGPIIADPVESNLLQWQSGALVNVTAGSLGVAGIDAGLAFLWSTAISGDPGAGNIRGNNATLASITSIAFDILDTDGGNVEATLQELDNSTSSIKANLFIFDAADKSNWLHLQLTALFVDQTGYWTGAVNYVNSNGVMTNGNLLQVQILPNGDKGDTGPAGAATTADDTVQVASTANVAIATALETGDTIDGVVLVAGDLVLLKDQTAPAENGVYTASASGVASRNVDYDTYDEHPGKIVSVQEGTANADSIWLCTSDIGGTLETTAIAWSLLHGSATATTEGIAELATLAELNLGTDTVRIVTPDVLAGSVFGTAPIVMMPFDNVTDVAVGDGAGDIFFRIPTELNGMDIIGVAAANVTAGTGTGTTTVQVRRVRAGTPVDVLSTRLTIDPTEIDSSTAAVLSVINTANDDLATGDQLFIDVDALTGTLAAKGLLVEIRARLP